MPPLTLFRYICARLLIAVGALFVILASLIFLVDLIENMRFAGKVPDADFGFALTLTLLRTPSLAQVLSPFVFLFGSIWTFNQLNRRSEIAVMRSAGLSVWRLIGPAALIAAVFGLILVTSFDPLSSQMLANAEKMKNDIRGKSDNLVSVSGDGIWLRQKAQNGSLIISAVGVDKARGALNDVTVWRLDNDNLFRERIDSPIAYLSDQTIELHGAVVRTASDRIARDIPVFALTTKLVAEDLGERVAAPETMSIWQLPRFTYLADAAGLSTVGYQIRFHDLCSTPLKLIAMVLIASMFSMRPWRGGGGVYLILYSVGAGFVLYILSEISVAFGESGITPIALSAWTPSLLATISAALWLLRMEEG